MLIADDLHSLKVSMASKFRAVKYWNTYNTNFAILLILAEEKKVQT